jgi:hypothetical protein
MIIQRLAIIFLSFGLFGFKLIAASEQLEPFKDSKLNQWGYKNSEGKVAISPRYIGAGVFEKGHAPIEDGNGFAMINVNGIIVERIEINMVVAGTIPIPAPDKSCTKPEETRYPNKAFECYVQQLLGSKQAVGGKVLRNPDYGEGYSASLIFRLPNGVIILNNFGYEGSSKRLILPGVSLEKANLWKGMLYQDQVTSEKDGCDEGMNTGTVNGGSYIELWGGC